MASSSDQADCLREVRFEHSRDFIDILRSIGVSLIVSTYQAGKVVVLGTNSEGLSLSFHNFEQAMGCAPSPSRMAIGSKTQIWMLNRSEAVASQLPPELEHDACYLTRSSHVTDSIDIHEMEWCGDELWFVNTRFSCLCTLDEEYSFIPRWRPSFISELVAQDRCHLNGMCCVDGAPRFVTAMSETDVAQGWRPMKATGGCIIDVQSGDVISRGFAMPHSPRIHNDRLWVLDSGQGRLALVDPRSGRAESVTEQPGYTRGLAFAGQYAFIGLSKIRETSTFGGIPIAHDRENLKCAVAVIDLQTGKRAAYFEFLSGVEEIFDVRIIPTSRNPFLYGPAAHVEGANPVWYAPAATMLPTKLTLPSPSIAKKLRTLELDEVPEEARLAFEKGNTLADENQFSKARAQFERALTVCPQFAGAYCNLGLAQQYEGMFDSAITNLEHSITLAPEFAAAHINLATTQFLAGDLRQAWHEYEWRWKCERFKQHPKAAIEMAPVWDGSSLAGRSLLIYGEQGVGDEVMFASCVAELQSRAVRIVLACEPRLVPLFRRSFPAAVVCSIDVLGSDVTRKQLGEIDYQIAAGSIPRYTRPTRDSFPSVDHYLQADPAKVEQFRERLRELGPGTKIGISWKGGATVEERRRRSADLTAWSPLLQMADAKFVNLQYGDCRSEIDRVRETLRVSVESWPDVDPLRDLDVFAAQVAAMDLIVSIDNSTLHFAGALGVPTIGLLSFPSSSYWRWFGGGEECVWYRKVRLLRRNYPEHWQRVITLAAQRIAINAW